MSFGTLKEREEERITTDLFQDLSRMSLQRQDENQVDEVGERELSLFVTQNDDIQQSIWSEILALENKVLTDEFDFRLYARYPTDTVEALRESVHQIESITMPSRIIPSFNQGARPDIPLLQYLREWHQDHEEPFPFHNLTHCVIEDPACHPTATDHRLFSSEYCTYVRQQVVEFFREENRRHPEVRIPRVIVYSQRIGPDRCSDCIAEIRRRRLGRLLGH
ncbi:uncharacterized protein Bfra_005766 [Botrytis fragariae]|uniref:Uncharacterized protein n=1 Tax=Botrytis fragariae TaxID=1964551 RepID=A0A8H6ARQ2_9HELO|nr:uncharacterized protein Bfra_005766 [Botrytis fragariae]KAF5872407.1 hypothetical protein Bfra_005766 [Botrytis fragariae]